MKFLLLATVACALELTTVKFVGGAANPTHYGDPKPAGSCQSDELAIQVTGVAGDFCSPSCTSAACPTDVPTGVTANPLCALQTSTGDKYCALICKPAGSNQCGTGTCKAIQGTGVCTYND